VLSRRRRGEQRCRGKGKFVARDRGRQVKGLIKNVRKKVRGDGSVWEEEDLKKKAG